MEQQFTREVRLGWNERPIEAANIKKMLTYVLPTTASGREIWLGAVDPLDRALFDDGQPLPSVVYYWLTVAAAIQRTRGDTGFSVIILPGSRKMLPLDTGDLAAELAAGTNNPAFAWILAWGVEATRWNWEPPFRCAGAVASIVDAGLGAAWMCSEPDFRSLSALR
jgi:hypothetical protein